MVAGNGSTHAARKKARVSFLRARLKKIPDTLVLSSSRHDGPFASIDVWYLDLPEFFVMLVVLVNTTKCRNRNWTDVSCLNDRHYISSQLVLPAFNNCLSVDKTIFNRRTIQLNPNRLTPFAETRNKCPPH